MGEGENRRRRDKKPQCLPCHSVKNSVKLVVNKCIRHRAPGTIQKAKKFVKVMISLRPLDLSLCELCG